MIRVTSIHELSVLAEQSATEARILEEAHHCAHPSELVTHLVLRGSYFDDTVTEVGNCRDCGEWLSRTHWLTSGHTEDRALTAQERDRMQVLEDRYRWADAK